MLTGEIYLVIEINYRIAKDFVDEPEIRSQDH